MFSVHVLVRRGFGGCPLYFDHINHQYYQVIGCVLYFLVVAIYHC